MAADLPADGRCCLIHCGSPRGLVWNGGRSDPRKWDEDFERVCNGSSSGYAVSENPHATSTRSQRFPRGGAGPCTE